MTRDLQTPTGAAKMVWRGIGLALIPTVAGALVALQTDRAAAILLVTAGALTATAMILVMPPSWLTVLFVFAIGFSAWIPASIQVQGLNVRASQVLLPMVYARVLLTRPRAIASRAALAQVIAGAVVVMTILFWTLAHSQVGEAPVRPVGRVLLLGLNLLHVAAIVLLAGRTRNLRLLVLSLMATVALLDGVLVLAAVARDLGVGAADALITEEDAPVLAEGAVVAGTALRFKFAGVTAGVMSAAVLIIAAVMLLEPSRRHRPWLWLIAASAMAGIVLGFSRQAVFSLAAGTGVVMLEWLRRGRFVRVIRAGAVVAAVTVAGLWGLGQLPGAQEFVQGFSGRALQLLEGEAYATGTAATRARLWAGMLSDIQQNPWVGAGQDAYLVHMVNPDESGAHNFPLEVLHAGGIVALVGYATLHVVIAAAAWRALRRTPGTDPNLYVLLGLVGAGAAVWLSSLTNLIYTNPVYWLVFGLIGAAAREAGR